MIEMWDIDAELKLMTKSRDIRENTLKLNFQAFQTGTRIATMGVIDETGTFKLHQQQ